MHSRAIRLRLDAIQFKPSSHQAAALHIYFVVFLFMNMLFQLHAFYLKVTLQRANNYIFVSSRTRQFVHLPRVLVQDSFDT